MMAVVGSETSFEQGREQLALLAGLEVTTKAVERQAEALGAEIAAQEQAEIQQGLQLELPQVGGPKIPVLYVERDGTGVPMVGSETEGRAGKQSEQARRREVKLGCVFTRRGWMPRAGRLATKPRPPTPEPSKQPKPLGGASTSKRVVEVGTAPGRRW